MGHKKKDGTTIPPFFLCLGQLVTIRNYNGLKLLTPYDISMSRLVTIRNYNISFSSTPFKTMLYFTLTRFVKTTVSQLIFPHMDLTRFSFHKIPL